MTMRFPSWNAPPAAPVEPEPAPPVGGKGKPAFEVMGQWYDADGNPTDPPVKEKNLTAAQVITAVRRGAVSREDALDYLMGTLNLDAREASALIGSAGGSGGSGGARARAPRYPDEEEEAALKNDLLRAQLAKLGMSAEDTALEREYRSQRDAINDAYREARFAYEKATDERNFGEQQRQFGLMQKLREQAAALDEKRFSVQTDLGYAGSRREDLGVNLRRAELYGYDPNGDTGVAPGTVTASERSRQYQQQLGIQDRTNAQAERERERLMQQEREQFQRGVTIRQLDEGDAARAEQERGVRLDRAIRVAGMRGRIRGQ